MREARAGAGHLGHAPGGLGHCACAQEALSTSISSCAFPGWSPCLPLGFKDKVLRTAVPRECKSPGDGDFLEHFLSWTLLRVSPSCHSQGGHCLGYLAILIRQIRKPYSKRCESLSEITPLGKPGIPGRAWTCLLLTSSPPQHPAQPRGKAWNGEKGTCEL